MQRVNWNHVMAWASVFAIFGTGSVRAETNAWTSIGPSGGNAHALAVDPLSPGTVYAGTSRGVLKSTDGGANWRAANSGLRVSSTLVIDSRNPNTIYAGGSAAGQPGIFKSTDGGASWLPAFSGLESSVQEVQSVAIDPRNSGTIYAGTLACFQPSGIAGYVDGGENLCGRSGVFKSTNGGATWTAASAGLPWDSRTGGAITALAVDPRDSNTVYASAREGVFKTANGGAAWTRIAGIVAGTVLFIDPRSSGTIYLATWNGVFKTIDGGVNWIGVGAGLPDDCCGSFAIDPGNPGTMYVGGRYGVYKSTGSGANWTSAALAVPRDVVENPLANIPSIGLAVDPHSPGTVYAATPGLGLFKSTDQASSWSPVNSGLTATFIYAVAADAQNPGTIYAGTLTGLFKTTDGGVNWIAPSSGLPAGRIVESIAIDPQDSSTLYAAMSGVLGFDPFGRRSGGIFKSMDGGATWTTIGPQVGSSYLFPSLTIDPHDPRTVYAGLSQGGFGAASPAGRTGILKSQDGGTTWMAVGPFPNEVQSVVIDPQHPSNVYGVAGQVIFKSANGGENWEDLGAPRGKPMPESPCDDCDTPFLADIGAFAIDPRQPHTLYAGGYAGVSKSTDGGASWKVMNDGLPPLTGTWTIGVLMVDPQDSNTVYATSIIALRLGQTYNPGQLFRSTDGGSTWSPIEGSPAVTTIAADPQIPHAIYAGTNGSGIFALRLPHE